MEPGKYYLKIGKAPEVKSPKERIIYRAFEIFPGALAWTTLLGVVFLSWYRPVWIAFFIIGFDVYWLFKTTYLSFHLRASYKQMKKSMKIDWFKELKGRGWQRVCHLVIMPFYQEGISVLRPTFEALVNSNYPKDKMIVILGVERRAGKEALETARTIEQEFGRKFFKFLIAVHPDDIVGEIKGKSANATWAARQGKDVIDRLKIPYENIIVTCSDIDTRVHPQYFANLTYHYLTTEKPTRTSYQPVPVFNNNIWKAPALSRVVATSATFWQMIQQQRPERLSTFSSQAISLQALVDVDFWQTNIVSEDSRIFWQCLLRYDGDYRAVPLYCPVFMDANLARNFWKTCLNVYRQQRRWGWGAENMPYLFFGFFKNKKIRWREKWHWAWVQIEGFWSWATNALMIFMLGWLPLYLGGEEFNATLLSYNLPRITRILMTLAMIGLIGSAIYSTSLLPPRPKEHGILRHLMMVLQWVLVPFTILVFGALPGLEAQTRLILGKYMGFWVTPKE